jgi:NAD dependent epimerase/dehydratase family enzyme
MKILVTGGTGFVGKKVVDALLMQKHEVWVLSRSKTKIHQEFSGKVKAIIWNGEVLTESSDLAEIEGVINLMGENISSKRWSDGQKKNNT